MSHCAFSNPHQSGVSSLIFYVKTINIKKPLLVFTSKYIYHCSKLKCICVLSLIWCTAWCFNLFQPMRALIIVSEFWNIFVWNCWVNVDWSVLKYFNWKLHNCICLNLTLCSFHLLGFFQIFVADIRKKKAFYRGHTKKPTEYQGNTNCLIYCQIFHFFKSKLTLQNMYNFSQTKCVLFDWQIFSRLKTIQAFCFTLVFFYRCSLQNVR